MCVLNIYYINIFTITHSYKKKCAKQKRQTGVNYAVRNVNDLLDYDENWTKKIRKRSLRIIIIR